MIFQKNILRLFLLLSITISFIGCGSSTRSQRYQPRNNGRAGAEASQKRDVTKNNDSGKDNLIAQDSVESNDEFEVVPVEENPVDKSKFVTKYEKLKNFNVPLTSREKILFEVVKYLDAPYKYGGNSENGIDCSAFTKHVYENSITVVLPRSAREQYGTGEKISREELKFGDLVFFNTRRTNNPGHVGIYLGDNQFVHASRTLGVTVSSLDSKYYKMRYTGARRIIETPVE